MRTRELAGDGVAGAEQPPVTDGRAPEVAEPVFTVPDRWRPHVHERRGGRVRSAAVAEPDAVAAVRAELATWMPKLEAILAHPDSDATLVAAARAHLAGAVTPTGAAVLAALLECETAEPYGLISPDDWKAEHSVHPARVQLAAVLPRVADAWVVEHGLVFAARAAVEAYRVDVHRVIHQKPPYALRYVPQTRHGWPGKPVMRRVRSLLAAASDADYAAAVAAVEAQRDDPRSRLAAVYLVPTRQDWVDQVCDECEQTGIQPTDWLVTHSFGSAAQLERMSTWIRGLGRQLHLSEREYVHTLADGIGADLAPYLASLLDRPYLDGDERALVLGTLVEFPTAEAVDQLLSRVDGKGVRPALLDMARRYPLLAMRRFAARDGAGALLTGHLKRHPELADQVDLPAEARAFVEQWRAERASVVEAPADALPAVLVSPPWTDKRKTSKPLVVKGLTPPDYQAVEWEPGEQAEWAAKTFPAFSRITVFGAAIEAFQAGKLSPTDQEALFTAGPVDELRPLLSRWRPTQSWYSGLLGKALLGRYGVAALPHALHLNEKPREERDELILPLVSVDVARVVAERLATVKVKATREVCREWLRRHPGHAARLLVPDAVGPAGARRRAAEAVLRLVPEQQVRDAAREYGPEAEQAIDQLLSVDPLTVLPSRIPVPGDWVEVGVLPRVLLRGTRLALPAPAVGHLLTMLAMCTPESRYPGVDVVRAACDPASLARFAWELFQLWQQNGMPAKDGWVLTALGLLGDDDVVRELAPLIRQWPGEGQHKRAVAGLDVLTAIGTDAALVALNRIAQRVKFKALQQRAQEKISAIAADRGLTAEQLADRLVPDFGLAEAGTLTIDYGPRRFTVGFDEQLKPFVLDQDGKRLKDLPKPGAKDDQELAPAEHKRFTQLKKDVRGIASDQVARLEQAMVRSRRWSAAEFHTLLAGHPLLRHLVRRLVWVTEDGRSFRVAEDGTLADVRDDAFALPEDALVGVAHPLHLGADLAGWTELFADYVILQPFRQLDRQVHRFDAAELAANQLDRFADLTVDVDRLLGLTKRGWRRGAPMDAGFEPWITRPVPGGGSVAVHLDPGIAVGMVHEYSWQRVREVWLSEDEYGHYPRRGNRTFAELDPVTASEVLAELASLTSPTS